MGLYYAPTVCQRCVDGQKTLGVQCRGEQGDSTQQTWIPASDVRHWEGAAVQGQGGDSGSPGESTFRGYAAH